MTLVVSICPKTEEELAVLWKRASSIASVELRLDSFSTIPWKALQEIDPLIITVGALPADIVARAAVLCAASTTPKYLDISIDHEKALFEEIKSAYPEVKIIASYHNFTDTNEDLDALYDTLKMYRCDAIKIATVANSSIDAMRLLLLMKSRGGAFPLIAISMGHAGAFMRVLAPLFGSPISYCCLEEALKTAPGQLTYDEMMSTYNFSLLSPATKPCALIGDPISLSYSHVTHNAIFKEYGVDAVYVKITVDKEQFEQAMLYLSILGFHGISITMPLKYCFDEKTSYNTARLGKDPALCNTDGSAAVDAIEQYGPIQGKQVAIIGAGPTAISIAQAAAKRGASVAIFNRSEKKVGYRFYPKFRDNDRYTGV